MLGIPPELKFLLHLGSNNRLLSRVGIEPRARLSAGRHNYPSTPFLHIGLQHGSIFLVQKTGICSRAKSSLQKTGIWSRVKRSLPCACGATSNLISTASPTGRVHCLLYLHGVGRVLGFFSRGHMHSCCIPWFCRS